MRTHASTHARVFKSQLRRVRAKKNERKNCHSKRRKNTKHRSTATQKKIAPPKCLAKSTKNNYILRELSVDEKKPTTTTADDQEIWRRFARRRHKHNHSGRVAKHSATKRPNDHPNTITVDHERERENITKHSRRAVAKMKMTVERTVPFKERGERVIAGHKHKQFTRTHKGGKRSVEDR